MRDEQPVQIRHLRTQAGKLGLAIKTKRASRSTGSRAYNVVDRNTGQVIGADLPDLVDVQTQLWWIVRDRAQHRSRPGFVNEVPEERCPTCGTPRVAFYRLCLSCGLDYEANRTATRIVQPKPPWRGPHGGLARQSTPQADQVEHQARAREPMTSRLAALTYDVADRLPSWRQLAGGAIIGLVAGATVALLGALR